MSRMFKLYDNINDTTLNLVLDYCVLKYKNDVELQKCEYFRKLDIKSCIDAFKDYNISVKKIEQYMISYANALHYNEDSSTKANNVYNLLIENIFDGYSSHNKRYLNAKKFIIQYLETYYENEIFIKDLKDNNISEELKIAQELRYNNFHIEIANDVYNLMCTYNKVEPLYFQSNMICRLIKDKFIKRII